MTTHFVAFDSSKHQTLVAAWNCLNEELKRAFWLELHVYVMVLPQGASMGVLLHPPSTVPCF